MHRPLAILPVLTLAVIPSVSAADKGIHPHAMITREKLPDFRKLAKERAGKK